ncbi:MAG: AraC family transcriptional regulator [Victivallaceae bacterium]|jgi:AraC-like DNA-binding protein/uncharacterized cupin superfamily protein
MTFTEEKRKQYSWSLGINFLLAGELWTPIGWHGKPHSHYFFEQLYILQGEAEVRTTKFREKFNAGQIILICPDTGHSVINCGSESLSLIYIGFSLNTSHIKKNLPEILLPELPEAERKTASILQKNTIENYKKGTPPLTDLLQAITGSLRMLERFSPDISDFHINGLVDEACRYINEHIDRNLSVRQLAGKLYLSPEYFGEIFKTEIGITLKQYHNAARMRMAFELLSRKQMNISQISEKLGFSAPEYFSRQFKKYFGISPVKVAVSTKF